MGFGRHNRDIHIKHIGGRHLSQDDRLTNEGILLANSCQS
jgi:hypothetical protein